MSEVSKRSFRPLVISMAFNYYENVYERNIKSHSDYCNRFGFDYVLVNRPSMTILKMESAWLKIPLILSAMRQGRYWVMYVDVDAEFTERALDFRKVRQKDKDVYLAPGFSGRVNSGVIITKNTEHSKQFFTKVLASAGKKLPLEDRIGWGENGEIINAVKTYPGFKLLPRKWNNNSDKYLADYVRHYSAGPMRSSYELNDKELEFKELCRAYNRSGIKKIAPGSQEFYNKLQELFREVVGQFPEFGDIDENFFRPQAQE